MPAKNDICQVIWSTIRQHLGEYPAYTIPKKEGGNYIISYGQSLPKEDGEEDKNVVIVKLRFEEKYLVIEGWRNNQNFEYSDAKSFDMTNILGFICREILLAMNFQHLVDVQKLESIEISNESANKELKCDYDIMEKKLDSVIEENSKLSDENEILRDQSSGVVLSKALGVVMLRLCNTGIVFGVLYIIWYFFKYLRGI